MRRRKSIFRTFLELFVKDDDLTSPRLLITCANANYAANYLKGSDTLSDQTQYVVIVDTLNTQPLQQGLGQTVCLTFVASDSYTRTLNTTLLAIEDKGLIGANRQQQNTLKRRYQLTLGSRLSLLDNTQHSRIFIETELSEILSSILSGAGYHSDQIKFSLASSLPLLDQCVQAMESNLAFFKRLLRQYGLFYWFDSTGSDAGLVISDNNSSSPYLARGLLQVHHGDGFNSERSSSQLVSDNSTKGFVGFTQCQQSTQMKTGLASATANDHRLAGEDLAAHNFAQPVSNKADQASKVAQYQSQALNRFEQVLILTGNVPDIFAGCSFSLSDNSGINVSGDYLCIAVEHHCQQPSDETSQDGLSKYHCVVKAIPRSQAFKLPFDAFPPLPMVFSAKVESLSPLPTLTDSGEYFTRLNFDKTANEPMNNSQSLRKLVNYACAHQPQATGWHFPLAHDAQVLIGCLNNDPSQAYLIGFDMNEEQPSIVNAENAFHNRILSRSGHELRFDDDEKIPNVILQTLGSEHYLELNATTQGQHFIQWISRLGSISLHAAKELSLATDEGDIAVNVGGYQHVDAKEGISFEVAGNAITIQSATHVQQTAQNIALDAEENITLLTGRSIKTAANSKIMLQAEQGDLTISAPQGSTVINANGNISIEGTGSGDITLFNQGGMIKLDSGGNVELIGKDVLTLNGQMVTLDGEVSYDNQSPTTASEPNVPSPNTIGRIAGLGLSQNEELNAETTSLELSYFDNQGNPVEDIEFEVIDNTGSKYLGQLQSGIATLDNLPIGQYEINYLGTSSTEENKLVELRNTFKKHLANMLVEIREKAAQQDALFEQESLFTQWCIQTGAAMTGVYQGGKSLVTGIADLVTLAIDVNIQVYSACFDVINSISRGDQQALKLQLETILANSEKTASSLTEAFELLVTIMEDEETRDALANFPEQYFNAHSFVDKHRIGGIFLFEILLAILTAGAGSAVSAASKSKHLSKANKSLNDIAELLKRKRLNKKQTHALETTNTRAVAKIEKSSNKLEAPKFKRLPHPVSLDDALNRLKLARQNIMKHGYRAKYSDDELLTMAQAGKVANERFHVRIMDANYLEYKGKPGALGQAFDGTSGHGAKYWSTTFDQLEDADSDPKLISLKLGLDYDPNKSFVMVLVDTEKAKEIADTHSMIPTFDNLGTFTKQELPNNYTAAEIDKLMTPNFQAQYSKLYKEALNSGFMETEWDANGALKYLNNSVDDPELLKLMKKRLKMQNDLGNNQHFLGNGLTKTLLPNNGQYGAVETFNFERKFINLKEFDDAIQISNILKPIGL